MKAEILQAGFESQWGNKLISQDRLEMVPARSHKPNNVGSNPTPATMGHIFKYNNKIYQATNLDKKLKRLRLNKLDIEILSEVDNFELEKEYIKFTKDKKEEPQESWHNPRLYYYLNPNTGYSITSIYPNVNVDGYEQVSKELLNDLWNKRI